jgi:hypothetical protein
VLLEGADTALVGYLKGLNLQNQKDAIAALSIGTKVYVHFSKTPAGTAADYWFELSK